MFGFGKKELKYQVMSLGIKVKQNGVPLSTYFQARLVPLYKDGFNIKSELIIDFTLDEVLHMNLSEGINEKITYLKKLENSPTTEWDKRAMNLFSDINKKLYHKVIEMKLSD